VDRDAVLGEATQELVGWLPILRKRAFSDLRDESLESRKIRGRRFGDSRTGKNGKPSGTTGLDEIEREVYWADAHTLHGSPAAEDRQLTVASSRLLFCGADPLPSR